MSNCFVVMPFRPELHYMYLFLKKHIEEAFPGVSVERGDDSILTRPILEKIAAYIKQADVVIADCSGRNPNVFYELGMAHALEKPVILITADEVEEAPTDIRAFEFIKYTEGPKSFADKLDQALRRVLGNQFDKIYDVVEVLFDEFSGARAKPVPKATKLEFSPLAAQKAAVNGLPKLEDTKRLAKLFLPVMVQGPADLDLMLEISQWIEHKFP